MHFLSSYCTDINRQKTTIPVGSISDRLTSVYYTCIDSVRLYVIAVTFIANHTSSTPPMPPHRVNIPDKGVGLLMESIIGAFQWIAGANPAPVPANPAPVSRGLLLEHLRVLDVKEFAG
ncbi:hypothetical protein J1N35_014436, partial [Gossypium stocksii]